MFPVIHGDEVLELSEAPNDDLSPSFLMLQLVNIMDIRNTKTNLAPYLNDLILSPQFI